MKLVFATTNAHKLHEVRAMLPHLDIVDLNSIGFTEEVEETGTSFEENAYIKAKAVFDFVAFQQWQRIQDFAVGV